MASYLNKEILTRTPAIDVGKSSQNPHVADARTGEASYLNTSTSRHFPLRIALIYAGFAIVWVVVTDILVELAPVDAFTRAIINDLKGWLFVAVTSALLYYLIQSRNDQELNLVARLRETISGSNDGLWIWNLRNDHIEVTTGGDSEVGWPAAETIHNMESWRAVVHPDDWINIADIRATLNDKENENLQIEQRIQTKTGGWHWFQIKGHVTSRDADGNIEVIEGTHHSIDALKQIQIELEHANRALKVLVATYRAISSCSTREEVFIQLVNTLTQEPEYSLVWIGEAVVEGQRIVPLTSGGASVAYLDDFVITWNSQDENIGSAGIAINSGKPCLVEDARETPRWAKRLEKLKEHNIRSAVAIPILLNDGTQYILKLDSAEPQSFAQNEYDTYKMIGQVLSLAISSFDVNFRFAQSETARVQIADRLQIALQGTIAALVEIVEKRDPYTAGHQQRVAKLAVAFGIEMGVSSDRLEGIYIGASIHDIGKIGVPTEILSKPGKLDETEIALIRRHPVIGNDIVKNIDFGWPVEKIVHQHHERWDGTGYPCGLKGEEIALEARIVAVADVVESMGTNRPYRPSIAWERVLGEIRDGKGTRYDPVVVDAALSVLERNAAKYGLG